MKITMLALLVGVTATDAHSQSLEFSRPVEPSDASPEIIGGSKASVADWPASFIFTSLAGAPCTATAVGKHVIMTAAHCLIGNDGSGHIKGTSNKLECKPHPSASLNFDIALCFSSLPIPLRQREFFETLELEKVKAQSSLTLLGYGCVAAGGIKGVLYQGAGRVANEVKLATFQTKGGASVCSGDSGGAAFKVDRTGARRVVGVASAAELGDSGISNFVALSTGPARKFLVEWRTARRMENPDLSVDICGVDYAGQECGS